MSINYSTRRFYQNPRIADIGWIIVVGNLHCYSISCRTILMSYLPFHRTVERLSGVAAKELFKLQENELVERLGEDEGKRLYNELQVQSGAMTVSNKLLSLLSSSGSDPFVS